MRFIRGWCVLIWLLTSLSAWGQDAWTTLLLPHKHNQSSLNELRLTDAELRWLVNQQTLTVAIDNSQTTTLMYADSGQNIRGINADYLALLRRSLKIDIQIRQYRDHQSMMAALEHGDVDAVLSGLVETPPEDKDFAVSAPLVITYPVLVTAANKSMSPLSSDKPVKIARVKDYPSDTMISASFPKAEIVSYSTYYQALASVYEEENQYFIGSNIITSNAISRYFPHLLTSIKYFAEPCQHNYFLTAKNRPVLTSILNRFVGQLSNDIRSEITQNWLNSGNLGYLNQPLDLTSQERKWIKTHPQLKVLVSPFNPPFSMIDEGGNPRGVMGDLLNIIELQTGLTFIPVIQNNDIESSATLPGGDWDLFPGAIYSEAREQQANFSQVLVKSPYVMVMHKALAVHQQLTTGMRVAVPPYYGISEKLKVLYPNVIWVAVANASAAFHQVQNGELDAVVTTQATARFMVDHYFPKTLDFFRIFSLPDAIITIALPRAEPELKSIIGKALNHLPPSEILRLTDKWTRMPDVSIDTWQLYSREFYGVLILASALILSSLLWGGYLWREVQRRKKIQGSLENQISFRKALSDSLPMAAYVADPAGNIISHNRAFRQFFNETTLSTALLPLTDPRSPFVMTQTAVDLNNAKDDKRIIYRETLNVSNGCEVRIVQHWRTLCRMPASADQVFICGWEDISELQALIQALEREKNKAINATEAKSQFLASMSHELRTPVSSIMGFLELLTQEGQSPEQRTEAINLAYATGQSLLGLIGEVLDVDKIESGHYQLQPQWLDMTQHIHQIAASFQAIAAGKHLQLITDLDLVKTLRIRLDPQALKQVLVNLLSNALKFTDAGSVILRASLTSPTDSVSRLVISVADTGNGISATEQQLLFKRYSQTATGRQKTGAGLGLIICQQLVDKMSGTLSLTSEPGVGTTFTLSIPVDVDSQPVATLSAEPDADQLPPHLNILIADDHPTNRLLLRRQLSSLGYDVTEACDGAQALQKLSEQRFDLLITDINMPHLDGIALTRIIRHKDRALAIWGLTANAQTQEQERALNSGMNACLFKPLTLTELRRQLSLLPVSGSAVVWRHLDIPALASNCQEDPALMQEILSTFSETTAADLVCARQRLENNDIAGVKKSLHRIKGSASILNLRTLMALCQQCELLAPDAEYSANMAGLLEQMTAHLRMLDEEITRFGKTLTSSSSNTGL